MLHCIAVDAKSIHTLELSKILDRLAGHAAFSASKDLARALEPSADLGSVRRMQAETTEARRLLSEEPSLTIGGAHDVRPSVGGSARGSVLEPAELLDLKSTLIAARRIKRRLQDPQQGYPRLAALAAKIEAVPGLIDAISKTVGPRGEVLDGASEKLAEIRRDHRIERERLTNRLENMVSDPKIAAMLQEPIITQRDGRFVIPLRSEFKGQLESVVHDQSSSGATLFVEPLGVVEANNRVRELALAERDEVRRVLADLSARVGGEEKAISRTVAALASIDVAFAKARYAEELDANAPELAPWSDREDQRHPGSTLRLLGARHPLLPAREVVPIDLALDSDTYALVITGPNTGGKTVALKTAGLLALMAQCGMHLPAEAGSELSVFDAVFADIGDEQSIEQSLSTFSAHISNIIRILRGAGSRSLVLLDELGAGTDPQEGSALARALLSEFLARRSTTLVATHYPELKAFAHVTVGVRNASVEFDLDTLEPTYHLTVGLPGRSNALSIAARLGLEGRILDRARGWVEPEELQAESLLDEIHRQREAARESRARADEALTAAAASREELEARLEAIAQERREVLESAREEGRRELEALREQLAGLRRELRAARQPLEKLEEIQAEVEQLEEAAAEPTAEQRPSPAEPPGPFRVGDRVRMEDIDMTGVIKALSSEDAEIQVGRLRVRAQLDRLRRVEGPAPKEERSGEPSREAVRTSKPAPPMELDLRGQRVEGALEELDRRLDAAYLAGMPFLRVIHGKGTGRLRQAVRQALGGSRYVASFEPGLPGEGGNGVTVVKMAES